MATSARLDELKKKFDENPRRYFAPLANEYRKLGDLTQAIAICRAHLPNQVGHISGHIVLAQALYEARELGESRQIFEASLDLDPENLIALRYLGDIAREQDDPASARTWYERVLDADPRNDEIVQLLRELSEATEPRLSALDLDFSTRPTPAAPNVVYGETSADQRVGTQPLDDQHDVDERSFQTFIGDSGRSEAVHESMVDPFADELISATPIEDPFADHPVAFDASASLGEFEAMAEPSVDDWFAAHPVQTSEPLESVDPPFSEALFPDLSGDSRTTPAFSAPVDEEANDERSTNAGALELREESFSIERPATPVPPMESVDDWRGAQRDESVAPTSNLDSEQRDPSFDYAGTLEPGPVADVAPETSHYSWSPTSDHRESTTESNATTAEQGGATFDEWQRIAAAPIDEASDGRRPGDAPVDAFDLSGSFELTEPRLVDEPEHTSTNSVDSFVDVGLGVDEDRWHTAEVAPMEGLVSMEAGAPPANEEFADPALSFRQNERSLDDVVHYDEPARAELGSTPFIADPVFGRTPLLDDVVASPAPAGFVTETMAELYVQQGFISEALAIYQQLLERDPQDATLKERIAALERPSTAEPEIAKPRTDREGQSVRSFFARFARRALTRASMLEGDVDDGGEGAGASSPPSNIASEAFDRFSGVATRAEALTVADVVAPTGSSLSQLFASVPSSRQDEAAASTLSLAFSAEHASEPRPDQTTGQGPSQERELSLEHLFRDVPARSSGAATLDEYFAGAPGPDSDIGEGRREVPEEHDADIEQFTAWLEGLKKK